MLFKRNYTTVYRFQTVFEIRWFFSEFHHNPRSSALGIFILFSVFVLRFGRLDGAALYLIILM